jgi:hypothetical protein
VNSSNNSGNDNVISLFEPRHQESDDGLNQVFDFSSFFHEIALSTVDLEMS